MPYTNVWVDNTPAGGDSAANLSADLRRLKLDISERLESIIPGWQTDDPVSLVAAASSIEFAKSYNYNAALPIPPTLATVIKACLVLDVFGTTGGPFINSGEIEIDFQVGEFEEDWDLSTPSLIGIIPLAWWSDTLNDFVFPFVDDPITSTVITFTVKDQDGSIQSSSAVRGRVLLFFGTIAAPTFTNIAPNSGAQGANVNVTLTGTNFVGTSVQINVSGTLITVTNIIIVSTTSITATFNIDAAAALGVRTVSVTTVGGTSGTQNFTVT